MPLRIEPHNKSVAKNFDTFTYSQHKTITLRKDIAQKHDCQRKQ